MQKVMPAAPQDKKILKLSSLNVRLTNFSIINQQERRSNMAWAIVIQYLTMVYHRMIKQLKVSERKPKSQLYITMKG